VAGLLWRPAIVMPSNSRLRKRPFSSPSRPRRSRGSGPAEVVQRYGVEPRKVPDFIALRGDPSDKIPGAAGVGAKTAAALLRKYGSLEKVLASGRFQEEAAQLRLYRTIATMDKTAPLPVLRNQKPSWQRAAALASEWGLNRLAERLESMRKASTK
jgi:DNA polymerase-1